MKLVVNLKLKPSPEQARSLRETLERCNAACDWLSERAFATRTFRQFSIHKASYFDCKSRFSLTAQAVVRCIAKVSDSYKIDSKSQRYFRKHSAQPYDDRIFRFASEDSINIWTVNKRQTISFECGEYQRKMLPFRKGEVDLMFVRNNWYIAVVCDIDEPDIIDCTDILGIDLGVVNIATDSDGTVYSGSTIEHNRRIQSHRRRNLHRKRTRAATRKLNILRGIQARFQKHTNHCISKAIVADAIATERAIAIEDLSGIRSRVKAKRRQRA